MKVLHHLIVLTLIISYIPWSLHGSQVAEALRENNPELAIERVNDIDKYERKGRFHYAGCDMIKQFRASPLLHGGSVLVGIAAGALLATGTRTVIPRPRHSEEHSVPVQSDSTTSNASETSTPSEAFSATNETTSDSVPISEFSSEGSNSESSTSLEASCTTSELSTAPAPIGDPTSDASLNGWSALGESGVVGLVLTGAGYLVVPIPGVPETIGSLGSALYYQIRDKHILQTKLTNTNQTLNEAKCMLTDTQTALANSQTALKKANTTIATLNPGLHHVMNRTAVLGAVAGGLLVAAAPTTYRMFSRPLDMRTRQACCNYKTERGEHLLSLALNHVQDPQQVLQFCMQLFAKNEIRCNYGCALINEQLSLADKRYPIHKAVELRSADLMQLFLKNGARVCLSTPENGYTAFHLAADLNRDAIIRTCMDHEPVDQQQANDLPRLIDQVDHNGYTALMHAATQGHRAAVDALVKHNMKHPLRKINKTNDDGFTALHIAAEGRHATLLQPLMTSGAQASSITSSTQKTPLHIASELDYADIVDLLLLYSREMKEDNDLINMQDIKGNTALFLAAQAGHHYVVDIALRANANPTIANTLGITPLMAACRIGHKYIVTNLLENMSIEDIKKQDNQAKNALHHILESPSQNKIPIVQGLCDAGLQGDGEAIKLAHDLQNESQDILKILQAQNIEQ